MEDDDIQISDSEEARASVSRLIKSIESQLKRKSNELELTAFGAALASGIISFHEFTSKTAETSALIGAISRVKQHLEKEYKNLIVKLIKCTSSSHKKWKN